MEEIVSAPETPEVKECVWCDRAFGIFGLVLGLAILYISVDVLLSGKVTTVLSMGDGSDD